MSMVAIRRKVKGYNRLFREVKLVATALKSPKHPVFAHMVVTRRCNLACTYCSEFDTHSKPVPTEEAFARVDRLAELGTTAITLTGGETLLHPDLELIVGRIRSHGIMALMVTNAYLLTKERIKKLNEMGLDRMQVSVDNVLPDNVSKKSLKLLDPKLRWLSELAEFQVHVHSVVGAGVDKPGDALTIAKRCAELGLGSSQGIVHDETGRLQELQNGTKEVLADIEKFSKPLFSFARHNPWRKNLLEGKPNDWHCPAGGRHLYICEDGLVHWCMAQRGYPAIPLARYSQADIDRENKSKKPCAPYCTVFCVHRVALLDEIRETPKAALVKLFPAGEGQPVDAGLPVPIKVLTGMFAYQPDKPGAGRIFRATAAKLLGIG
jgi:MoaA/NifB/PqqE/SkfB family radical SAM enzyme